MTTTSSRGRTQEERSAAMRRRLLDATVEALHERGYSATTTLEVQQRAGVSRGGLLYHYASRTELILAAVEHLTRERVATVIATARTAPPAEDRLTWAVGVLWSTFEGPLFAASLEVWVAARHDPDLLAALMPQERILGQAVRTMTDELFGSEITGRPGFPVGLEVVLDSMRGAASRAVLRRPGAVERQLEAWSDVLAAHVR